MGLARVIAISLWRVWWPWTKELCGPGKRKKMHSPLCLFSTRSVIMISLVMVLVLSGLRHIKFALSQNSEKETRWVTLSTSLKLLSHTLHQRNLCYWAFIRASLIEKLPNTYFAHDYATQQIVLIKPHFLFTLPATVADGKMHTAPQRHYRNHYCCTACSFYQCISLTANKMKKLYTPAPQDYFSYMPKIRSPSALPGRERKHVFASSYLCSPLRGKINRAANILELHLGNIIHKKRRWLLSML